MEYAEVVPGSPVRHFYSADGTPEDLEVKSSVVMHGAVLGVVDVPDDPGAFFGLHGPQDSKVKSGPTHEEFHFKLSKADDEAFNAWTKARVDRTMAIVFGDQILVQATIASPLSGVMQFRVPKSIRDEGLRKAIEAVKQNKK